MRSVSSKTKYGLKNVVSPITCCLALIKMNKQKNGKTLVTHIWL